MATCPHGRNLNTQVCKYCSCTHGKDTSTCQACQAVLASMPHSGPPASTKKTSQCVHGIDVNRICGKCIASGALGPSGSFSIRLPDDLGLLSGEELIKRQRELEYREKVAGLDKVPGAIRMFRTWQLDSNDNLRAMVANHTWRKGENIASSMVDGGYAGFFGFSSLAELQKQESQWWELSQSGEPHTDGGDSIYSSSFLNFRLPTKRWYVSGTFLAYGHMVIAEHGGRSQFAVPEYIVEPDGSDPDFSMRILAVAERYGMELISVATARELKVGAVPWWKGKPNA